LSFAMLKSLGSCALGCSLNFNGNFLEDYNTDLNTSFTFYTYVLKKRITNTIRANLFKLSNISFASGYSLFGLNMIHELSFSHDIHNSHRVEYVFNENSLVRANFIITSLKTQVILSFINKFEITDNLKFKANLMLFRQAAKLKLATEYKFNEMFKAIAEGEIVQAYEHSMNEYYKIENSFIGFGTTLGSAKLKIGASYRYTGFKEIEMRLSYYRLHISLPIILGEDHLATLFILFGVGIVGITSYLYKNHEIKKDLTRKFNLSKLKIEHINSKLSSIRDEDFVFDENAGKDSQSLNKNISVLIKYAYIVPKHMSKYSPEALKDKRINGIDCTKIVNKLFGGYGEIDFDKCIDYIDKHSEEKIAEVIDPNELAICIIYTEDTKQKRKILTKGAKTSLTELINRKIIIRMLERLLS